jgi:hypothetical protein
MAKKKEERESLVCRIADLGVIALIGVAFAIGAITCWMLYGTAKDSMEAETQN